MNSAVKQANYLTLAQQTLAAAGMLGLRARELADFQDEPPQMASGAVGKSAYLRLGFERRGERTILAELDRRVPFLVQRVLYPDVALPDQAWIFIITTTPITHPSPLRPRQPLCIFKHNGLGHRHGRPPQTQTLLLVGRQLDLTVRGQSPQLHHVVQGVLGWNESGHYADDLPRDLGYT